MFNTSSWKRAEERWRCIRYLSILLEIFVLEMKRCVGHILCVGHNPHFGHNRHLCIETDRGNQPLFARVHVYKRSKDPLTTRLSARHFKIRSHRSLAASKSPPSAVTILSGIGATRFPSSSTRAWTMPTFSAGVHFNRDLDLWYGGGCWGYNHGAKQKKKVPRTKKTNCVVRKNRVPGKKDVV